MRYAGIDYGEKRVGVALSDPEGRIAFPHAVFEENIKEKLIRELQKLIAREKVEKIIIGLPRRFDGSDSRQTISARDFGEELRKGVSIPLEYENEILTTKIAERASGKEVADASAAAIILQSYLDKQKSA